MHIEKEKVLNIFHMDRITLGVFLTLKNSCSSFKDVLKNCTANKSSLEAWNTFEVRVNYVDV